MRRRRRKHESQSFRRHLAGGGRAHAVRQVDGALSALDAIELPGLVARHMVDQLNGGSTAIGHAFGATGARIISQAVKELVALPKGNRAIVSICADGGQGSVMLLEAA